MIKFIFKIFKFIFTIFIALIIFTYIFSIKNDLDFNEAIVYLKAIGGQILNIETSNNILSDSEDVVIVTSGNNHYYYEQLDDTAKKIYARIETNIDNIKKENYVIDFSTTFNDLLNTSIGQYRLNKAFQSALDAFSYDHPELFYINSANFSLNTKCISIGSIKTYTVEIAPKDNTYLNNTFNSEAEVKRAIKQIEDIKNEIINEISSYSTYNKIKHVHDTLVNSIEYVETNNSHNIYGALVEKEVVCEGYAKAFKYLMDCLDIECILVCGDAINSANEIESHMWNYIKLNDAWYGVDVTWDDPIINGGSIKNNLRHDYFLKGYYTFSPSHSASGKISDTGMLFNIPRLSTENFKK